MPDTPKQTIAPERLLRFLTGELPAGEMREIEAWIAAESQLGDVVDELRMMLPGPYAVSSAIDVEAGWRRVEELAGWSVRRKGVMERGQVKGGTAISSHQVFPEAPSHEHAFSTQTLRTARQKEGVFSGRTLRRYAWPALAALATGVAITVAGWNAEVRLLNRREAASMLTYTTGNGQRANITLPDGSTVALNVASRLDVPADYVTGHHTVRLVGEALFTVTRHEGTPFTVIAGSATARVLGTRFVVRHYPTDTTATVAVRDGKVAVRSIVLTAARQVTVNRVGMMRVDRLDLSQFSFVTGVLSFNGVPLRDAIVMLDRWFDADVRLGDATLGAQKLAGGFTAGSLADLTESLELTFNVRVVRDGRILTVFPR